jgi:hypothetical protein
MMDKDKDGNRTVGDTLYSCRIFDGCDTTLEPLGILGEKSRKYKKKKEEVSSFALMFFVSTKSSLVLTKSTRKSR